MKQEGPKLPRTETLVIDRGLGHGHQDQILQTWRWGEGRWHPGPRTGLQATQDLRRGHVEPKTPHTTGALPSHYLGLLGTQLPSRGLWSRPTCWRAGGKQSEPIKKFQNTLNSLLFREKKKKVEKMHYQIESVTLSNPNLVGLWITGLDWQDMC